ncbi:MAG TPA: hypothetical protein VKU61_01355 [Candidatus Binatia bacterium]|nr:hypothetical protein [Candidatus Binatia bacterium]
MKAARAIVATILLVVACGGTPDDRYLLPDGYAGWVQITFNVPAAPYFPREDGFRLVTVPDTGEVETSEVPSYGEGYIHQYYWVRADGSRSPAMIGGGFSITGRVGGQDRWCFFVGDESDRKRYERMYRVRDTSPEVNGECARKLGRLPQG